MRTLNSRWYQIASVALTTGGSVMSLVVSFERSSSFAFFLATLGLGLATWLALTARAAHRRDAAGRRAEAATEAARNALAASREQRKLSELRISLMAEILDLDRAARRGDLTLEEAQRLMEAVATRIRDLDWHVGGTHMYIRALDEAEASLDHALAEKKSADELHMRLLGLSRRPGERVHRIGTGLAQLALRIAGPKADGLKDQWQADLAGAPEEGIVVTPMARLRHAAGFVVAALKLRLRLNVLVEQMWRPVDWVLSRDERVRTTITAAVGAQAVYIVDDGGLDALATEVWEPCAVFGGALWLAARFLRKRRGIEIAGHLPDDPEQ